MSYKLYVGGLPYATTEDQLSELFAAHGTVESARVITDRYTGQSRGFGFVELGEGEDIQRAIRGLNGQTLDGRTLTVNEAKPQSSGFGRPQGGGRQASYGSQGRGGRYSY